MFDLLASLCCFDLLASSHRQRSCCLRMTKSSFYKSWPAPSRWQIQEEVEAAGWAVLWISLRATCLFNLSLDKHLIPNLKTPKLVFFFFFQIRSDIFLNCHINDQWSDILFSYIFTFLELINDILINKH